MQISHLAHDKLGVRCTRCNRRFQLPSRVLSDPYRLVEAKEAIAGEHFCAPVRRAVDPVRVVHRPLLVRSGHDAYWREAIASATQH